MREVVIAEAVRTPIGRRNGKLKDVHPVVLGSLVLKEIVHRAGIKPEQVEDVVFGCVTQVGEQSLNIGRNAWLTAGFPVTTPATTVDRQCGSGQQALHFAANLIQSGVCDVTIAAGVESMSRVPMGSNAMQPGTPFPPELTELYDLVPQGISAELIARKYGISRKAMDEFGVRSHQRAHEATDRGYMQSQIMPVDVPGEGNGHTDLFTVNEAFASVVLAWQKETGADMDRTNVNGGAIAVGHPLGASGVILMNRLLYELERRDLRYGLETMCCGGGIGTATIIDRVIE